MPIDPADHLRLVYRYVRRHDPPTPNEEDRLQDAFEGLVRAAQSYDPERGAFSTHAHHSLRAYAGRGRQRLGSIGRFGSARRSSILYAHAAKVTRPGEVISPAWAEDLWQGPLTEAEYATVAAMLEGPASSLDKRVNDEEQAPTRRDALPDTDSASPEEWAVLGEWHALLRTVRASLTGLYATVFDLRMFPADDDPWTLLAVGEVHGVSRERARQVEEVIRRDIRIAARKVGLLDP